MASTHNISSAFHVIVSLIIPVENSVEIKEIIATLVATTLKSEPTTNNYYEFLKEKDSNDTDEEYHIIEKYLDKSSLVDIHSLSSYFKENVGKVLGLGAKFNFIKRAHDLSTIEYVKASDGGIAENATFLFKLRGTTALRLIVSLTVSDDAKFCGKKIAIILYVIIILQ